VLEIIFCTTAVFFAGSAFLPKYLIKSGPTLAFGIPVLITFGSVFSIVFGVDVGTAMMFGLFFSFALFLVRFLVDDLFKVYTKSVFLIQYLPLLFLSSLLVLILTTFNTEFASRNFDASYAIQDSIFLSKNPANVSSSGKSELLPLNWSASTKDRYGVSFLLSMVQKLGISNIWWSAKYVMVFLSLLLLLTTLILLKHMFSATRIELTVTGIIFLVTPSVLLPLQYFMFGQILGSILSFCIIIILIQSKKAKFGIYLATFILAVLFTSYPAMAFPMALFLVGYVWFSDTQNQKFLLRVAFSLRLIILSFFLLTGLYGFRFQLVFERIWIWISGVLFPPKIIDDLSPLQVTIFGQYISKIGLPLFTGSIRYPNFDSPNMVELIFLLTVSASFLLVFFLSHPYASSHKASSALKSFYFSWMLMAFVAYIKGSPYLFFKFSTWTMPLVAGVNAVFLTRAFIQNRLRFSQIFRKFILVSSSTGLALSSIAGIQHLAQLKEWNSFSQIAKTHSFATLNSIKLDNTKQVYLSTPTAEESVWLSGLMANLDQNRIQMLGPTLQALGGALSKRCSASKAQNIFDPSGYVVQDLETVDVVSPLVFKSEPEFSFGSISINSSGNIESGLILNSGGVYPPEIFQSDRNEPRKAIRWSTGQICFSLYSSKIDDQTVTIVFEKGPDFAANYPWIVSQDEQIITSKSSKNLISFLISPKVGWNTIQVQQPGCYSYKNLPYERWNLRADDRGLCFKVLKISKSDG